MNVGVPQEAIVNLEEALAKSPSIRKGFPRESWNTFFSTVSNLLQALTASGTTAQRPTAFLYVGRPYLDTTLGKPIWLKSAGPPVWIDATGAVV